MTAVKHIQNDRKRTGMCGNQVTVPNPLNNDV